MGKRAVIWCEVSCSNCGGVIGFDYKNAKTISALKRKVRDWKYCGEEGNLCPDCYKAWKNGREMGRDSWRSGTNLSVPTEKIIRE